ncbi:MAG: RNA-binding protein [Leptolyngbyaceae bacterium]|nr:RNA-binding protein [Leptolyngbyaceae bacterium]
MSIRLYVGNLPKEIEKEELEAVFTEIDSTVSAKLVTDRKTGKCRGFAFVTVKNDEQANQLIEQFNGMDFKDNTLKIEKALPRSKGKSEDAPGEANAPSSGNRRNSNNANRKAKRNTVTETEATQPDPRWAAALSELKERLVAQTNP